MRPRCVCLHISTSMKNINYFRMIHLKKTWDLAQINVIRPCNLAVQYDVLYQMLWSYAFLNEATSFTRFWKLFGLYLPTRRQQIMTRRRNFTQTPRNSLRTSILQVFLVATGSCLQRFNYKDHSALNVST